MTREEAVEKLMAETRSQCTKGAMIGFIDMSVALGMLDLDETKAGLPEDDVIQRLLSACNGVAYLATCINETIAKAGLKLVEK